MKWRLWLAAFILLFLQVLIARAEALEEVNLQRASWGQKALIKDEELTLAAQKIAEWQAYYQISLQTGYNGHEHPKYEPTGTSVGTGVSSSYGWSSCLMEVYGSYKAGAGLAIGSDGNRYMVLILQGEDHPGCRNGVLMIKTNHLTPDAPLIQRSSLSPPAQARGRFTRKDYSMYPGPPSRNPFP